MRCCLYDAAFAALVQVVPNRGRLAISYLTLYGAYASTVFWVIGHYLNEAHGWRGTLVIFAAINLAVCLPLNWFGLSWRETGTAAATAKPASSTVEGPVLQGRQRAIGMVGVRRDADDLVAETHLDRGLGQAALVKEFLDVILLQVDEGRELVAGLGLQVEAIDRPVVQVDLALLPGDALVDHGPLA